MTSPDHSRLILFLAPFVLAACATSGSPQAVVESFYRAASEGNVEEVRRLYAKQPVIVEDTVWSNGSVPMATAVMRAPSHDLATVLNGYTRNGTLTRVEILDVRVMGDTASCRVRKHFKDGATQEVSLELFRDRQQSDWKVSWSSLPL